VSAEARKSVTTLPSQYFSIHCSILQKLSPEKVNRLHIYLSLLAPDQLHGEEPFLKS